MRTIWLGLIGAFVLGLIVGWLSSRSVLPVLRGDRAVQPAGNSSVGNIRSERIQYGDHVLVTGGFYAGRTGLVDDRWRDNDYWLRLDGDRNYVKVEGMFLEATP